MKGYNVAMQRDRQEKRTFHIPVVIKRNRGVSGWAGGFTQQVFRQASLTAFE